MADQVFLGSVYEEMCKQYWRLNLARFTFDLQGFFFLFPAGLTILDMKVSDFCWMYWKGFWTRNSKDLIV